jgi:hypothetical protein
MKKLIFWAIVYVAFLNALYFLNKLVLNNQIMADNLPEKSVLKESKSLKQLTIVGNRIVDENGIPYQLVGVVSDEFRFHDVYQNIDDLKQRLSLFKQYGVNLLVLYLDRPEKVKGRLSEIIDLANWADKNGIYVLLYPVVNEENQIIGMSNKTKIDNFNFSPLDTKLDVVLDNLNQALKDNKNILYGTGAEPHDVSEKILFEKQVQLINKIHQVNPKTIVVVNGINYGSNLDNYLASPVIKLPNVLYDVHVYAGKDKDNIDFKKCRIPQRYMDGFPLFLGEFGGVYSNDFGSEKDLECIDDFYQDLAKNKISFAMYTLDSISRLSIIDVDNNLTIKGQKFVEFLEKMRTESRL